MEQQNKKLLELQEKLKVLEEMKNFKGTDGNLYFNTDFLMKFLNILTPDEIEQNKLKNK